MNEFTVRFRTLHEPIHPDFLDRLEQVAGEFGIVMESDFERSIEHNRQKQKLDEFIRLANECAQKAGLIQSDSADDIRELRDTP